MLTMVDVNNYIFLYHILWYEINVVIGIFIEKKKKSNLLKIIKLTLITK